MLENVKKDYNLLKILYSVRYFGDALFYCYFQLFLVYKGLSEGQIGVICAITPLTILVASPVWNHFCKNVNINLKVIKYITVLEGIFILTMGHMSTFELIAVITFLLATLSTPYYSLMDGFAGSFCDKSKHEYPIVRALGSFTYAFSCALGGILIKYINYEYVFLIAAVFFISCSVIIYLIKPLDLSDEAPKAKLNIKGVLTNLRYLCYMFFFAGTVVVSYVGDSFLSVYYKNIQNVTSDQYGFLYFGIVMVEVGIMFFAEKFFTKVRSTTLLIAAGSAFGIKALTIALGLPLPVIMIGSMIRGVGYGLFLYVNIRYLIKIVGRSNLTTAIIIQSLFQVSIQAITLFFSGSFIEEFGYEPLYMIIAGCCFASCIGYFLVVFIHGHLRKMA